MITPEQEAQILRYFHAEGWRVGTIATQLGVHHCTVRRVLAQQGVTAARASTRPSIVDPYVPLIVETLQKFPKLTASRLCAMARLRGYTGSEDHFRCVVARHRPRRVAEAFARLRTLPGEQGQVDWGHFGKLPGTDRALMAFVMVLSFSRRIFLRFYPDAAMPMFLRGHVDAFATFGGVTRALRYDNLKSAVLERAGDAVRFHPTLLALSAHYHFAPSPCRPYRGNEKGRVERAIRFIREGFFAGRTFTDLGDLNAQAHAWTEGAAAERRCPEDESMTVREAFLQERAHLLALPATPFPTDELKAVSAGKTPYVRFDLNDYSIPHTHVRRTLTVQADPLRVRILDGQCVIATHPRSYERGRQIELPAHIAELVAHKREAHAHRDADRLLQAIPASRELLRQAAERGEPLGRIARALNDLLDRYGLTELQAAIEEALARGVPHPNAVRLALAQRREAREAPPPLGVALSEHLKQRDLPVRPHSLADYDRLLESGHDDE